MRRTKVITLLSALLITSATLARGQECENWRNASSTELVSLLSSAVPDQNNKDCMSWAIAKLGNQRYEAAVPVLIRLLDFKRPLTKSETQGVYLHPQTVWELYPAARALDAIGKTALPALVTAIKAESTSDIARVNAVAVLMGMHKYEKEKGVALLKQEETTATDDATKRRLQWAVGNAVQNWCGSPPEDAGCRAAANPEQPR